ncbi:site-specific integrase [Frankia sp. B2]|uniref:tyrosine-type recombinase/integrase n=1 Tax=Frankia sp. B2 TaxID=2541730 RepID=UPI001069FECB|nr:tyrosine-type recombinase/integrase [Frankia sp. B2]TFE31044.1 site-specific integrase [Frankia sp. B2]
MKRTIFKRCGCKDPDTGKPLAGHCPRLRRKGTNTWRADHGTWYYAVDLPPGPDGKRNHRRRGGFATSDAADQEANLIEHLLAVPDPGDTVGMQAVVALIVAAIRDRTPLPDPEQIAGRYRRKTDLDPVLTVGQWLDQWLAGRRNISRSTHDGYEINIRLHLKPYIGDVPLHVLTVGHLEDLFDRIDARNDTIRRIRASGTAAEKAAFKGARLMGDANKQRVRATLRAALNAAIRRGRLTMNPAQFVELPSGKRPKALLWTAERVVHWLETGAVPSPVMVWTPDIAGEFLDHAEDSPLYLLFRLIAQRGPRRGEACALHWTDLAIDAAPYTVTIRWQITRYGMSTPKSDAGDRIVSLDADLAREFRLHRRRRQARRLAAGSRWNDTGLVFTDDVGNPLNPDHVRRDFAALVDDAGLPPIRVHDLRHLAATLALAAGADLKAVQALLGHSSIAITADTYTHVLPELAEAIAENVARLIPRTRHPRSA